MSVDKERRSNRSSDAGGHSTILYVRNISDRVKYDDLRHLFQKYGKLNDVTMPLDYYSGLPKGYCFIEFDDPRDAKEAHYRMARQRLFGREIEVEFARGTRKTAGEMRNRNSDRREPDRYSRNDRADRRSRDRSDRKYQREQSRSMSRDRSRSRSPTRNHSQIRNRSRTPSRGRSHSRNRSQSRDRSRSRSHNNKDKKDKSRSHEVNSRSRTRSPTKISGPRHSRSASRDKSRPRDSRSRSRSSLKNSPKSDTDTKATIRSISPSPA